VLEDAIQSAQDAKNVKALQLMLRSL